MAPFKIVFTGTHKDLLVSKVNLQSNCKFLNRTEKKCKKKPSSRLDLTKKIHIRV